jgi:hypothetical protein
VPKDEGGQERQKDKEGDKQTVILAARPDLDGCGLLMM